PHFTKSHGLGNDYIVIDPKDIPFEMTPDAVRLICDRNRGVGSDGILLVSPGDGADFGLRILNPDGSEAEKSGNGVRIFAKFLREHGYTDQDRFTLHTLGGRVTCVLEHDSRRVAQITVDMGKARFDPLDAIEVDGRRFEVTSVSVGNPHCVIVVPDLTQIDIHALGPKIEKHPAFPKRTNVQFAQVVSRKEVRILIWERGAGYTLASGSSSCAVAATCLRKGLIDRDVTISMPGGQLGIAIADDGEIRMRGPVEEICTGDLSPDLLRRIDAISGPPR
ncbi:MAG TPA: diaminopimelate epimerase, partial [Candidatus Limnocylindria bacterium]|nr:diaminopimelate epimerase [Candidatus Limnocylindria bacterium]